MDQDLIRAAIHEIKELRRWNEILSAKVEVIEVFSLALNASPPLPSPMGEDMAWKLEEAIRLDKEDR